ncbi:Hypothetical predicted protein, partial [Mytilus galloprovincialis]
MIANLVFTVNTTDLITKEAIEIWVQRKDGICLNNCCLVFNTGCQDRKTQRQILMLSVLIFLTVDTPRTVFRHSDSGIGSVRRSEQLSKQTNSPIYEKNVSSSVNGGGLGARPRSSVRFETSTPAAEKQTSKHFTEQLQFPISDKFVTKRASKTGLTRDTESCEDKQSYPLDGYKNKNIVKTATYDGKGPWLDFRSHFDACSQINNWTDKEKGLYLAVSLRGQAQGVLGNLTQESRQDFKELVKALEERFSPSNQTELYRTQRDREL